MTALQGGGEAGAKAELQGAQGTRADGKCQRQPQEVGEQGRGERREGEVSCVCVCVCVCVGKCLSITGAVLEDHLYTCTYMGRLYHGNIAPAYQVSMCWWLWCASNVSSYCGRKVKVGALLWRTY